MNTIQAHWETYSAQVIPKDASEAQIKATRRAFYAGVGSLHNIQTTITDQSDEAVTAILNSIVEELYNFMADIDAGVA